MDAATETMIRNLQEKTGKSIDEWVAVVKGLGPKKHGEIIRFLKETHQMGHGYANLVAHGAAGLVGTDAAAPEDLVSAQYAGEKAGLRPVYDQLIKAIGGFGTDVDVSPKKTYVSLRRSKQFALIQPTTRTRLDVGLNLKGIEPAGRLEASGSFNSMCTHRVRVESAGQIDQALLGWLKDAYDKA